MCQSGCPLEAFRLFESVQLILSFTIVRKPKEFFVKTLILARKSFTFLLIFVTVWLSFGGPGLSDAQDDDHSDTRAGATSLPFSFSSPTRAGREGPVIGRIDPGDDIDYFYLELDGSGSLTVETTGNLDTIGELQNSSGTRLSSDNNGGTDSNFRIDHAVSAGKYYVKVTSSGGRTGSYEIQAHLLYHAVDSGPMWMPDANLRAAVGQVLGVDGNALTQQAMEGLTGLDADNQQITNLAGLEHASNLTWLTLRHNQITDISPLANLTNLTILYLRDNQISNIAPLKDLTNLRSLDLIQNQVSDIRSLANLTNLTTLYLWGNQISNITPLKDLTKLTLLTLGENQVSDIRSLANLTNLTTLYLWGNQISNIRSLANLTNLTTLYLWDNQIDDVSSLANLTNLTTLNLWDNQISDIRPLANLTNLTTLSLGFADNQVSDIRPLANLTNLTVLGLNDNQIDDVSPFANLTNLTTLALADNQVRDVSSLANLTNLTTLGLSGNQISDITPLKGLTKLTGLWLGRNQISDIIPLKGLTKLTELAINGNQITDVSPLENFTNLTELYLAGNSITDMSPVVRLRAKQREMGLPEVNVVDIDLPEVSDGTLYDVTGDKVVDQNDFLVVVAQFGLRSAPATTDNNGDGYIDVHDIPPGPIQSIFDADDFPAELSFTEAKAKADLNGDGTISKSTKVFAITTHADLNDDGVVDFEDIKLIVARLQADGVLAAPNLSSLTPETIQQWLAEAKQMWGSDPAFLRSIAALEQFLALLTPTETALLPNYPNPFNPETWIPYQLAEPADVTLTLYDVNGRVVHTLDLGHQRAGIYKNRARAAYWDGRNTHGEPVASGVYFYTLSTGDFTATRKMLIRK